MEWINFPPLAEFPDRHGIVRSIYGCSLIGKFEFIDRQQQIVAIIDEAEDTETWQNLYMHNPQFQRAVDRSLELNGINPEWLTPQHIQELLFARQDEAGNWVNGWLIELNTREGTPSKGEAIETTLPNLLALVALSCDSLEQAIELASAVPGNLLLDTIEAKANLTRSPEQKAEDEKAKNLKSLKKN